MRLALFMLAAVALHAQSSYELLALAKQKILASLDRLPNYTCRQTLDRAHSERTVPWRTCGGLDADQEASQLLPANTDRYRLDVAVTGNGREIYSWAGGSRFDANSLKQIVAGGAVGSGSFGPFLINIFSRKGVDFTGDGTHTIDGKPLLKFIYQVPQKVSSYELQSAGAKRFIAYDGAFWIDPATHELVRLEVHTTSMPHNTGICESSTTVDFHHVAVGRGDYLLPRSSTLEVATLPGYYTNTIQYSACREYRGESTIHFGDPAGATAATTSAPAATPIPRGIPLSLAFESAIDTHTAAAGDKIRARLLQDAVDKKSKRAIAPAGTIAEGRIVRLEHQRTPSPQYLIAIEWESLQLGRTPVPFAATIDTHDSAFTVSVADLATKNPPVKLRNLSGGLSLVFYTSDENYVVPAGHESHWVTIGVKQ